MKNYLIGLLVVIILVLSSLLYKKSVITVDKKFPVLEKQEKSDIEVPLYIYAFFSKKSCFECIGFIEVLNNLPPQFIVYGVVPAEELKDEKEIRQMSGAQFPLLSASKYKRYISWSPSFIGVSPKGDVLFALPGIRGEKEYVAKFLDSLYNEVYSIFLIDNRSEKVP